jgi:hypothetical protein
MTAVNTVMLYDALSLKRITKCSQNEQCHSVE